MSAEFETATADVADLTMSGGRVHGVVQPLRALLPDADAARPAAPADRTTRRGSRRSARVPRRRRRAAGNGGRVMTAEGALLVFVLSLSAIVFAVFAVETRALVKSTYWYVAHSCCLIFIYVDLRASTRRTPISSSGPGCAA